MRMRHSVLAPAVALAIGLAGVSCSDATPTAPLANTSTMVLARARAGHQENPLSWQLLTGIASGPTSSVWASSPTDIWAAGGYRVLVHYDGSTWTQADLPTAANQYAVWGLGPNDVYTTGQYGYQTGQVLHWDGSSWKSMYVTNSELIDIWGSSPTDLYVVGDGRLVHYDGTTWADIPTGLSTGFNVDRLQSIWGVADTHHGKQRSVDVWMAGYHGRIMHYDGRSVTTDVEIPTETFSAIHGTGPRNIFAVGSHGLIWHFDGSRWSSMNSGTTASLLGVFAIDARDVYAAGEGGVLLHYDGHTWSSLSSGTTLPLGNVFALPAGNVYVGMETNEATGQILEGTR